MREFLITSSTTTLYAPSGGVAVLLLQQLLALLESVAASSSSSSSSIETGERGECMLRSSGSVCSGSSLLMCTICCGVRDRLVARRSIAEAASAFAPSPAGSGPKLSGSVRPGNLWCSSMPGGVGIFVSRSSDRSLDSDPPHTDLA
uniref:Secreted protein n=1 Tax=Anopheles merus TaxID=30066 RepID=A0A182VII0_ANOME